MWGIGMGSRRGDCNEVWVEEEGEVDWYNGLSKSISSVLEVCSVGESMCSEGGVGVRF